MRRGYENTASLFWSSAIFFSFPFFVLAALPLKKFAFLCMFICVFFPHFSSFPIIFLLVSFYYEYISFPSFCRYKLSSCGTIHRTYNNNILILYWYIIIYLSYDIIWCSTACGGSQLISDKERADRIAFYREHKIAYVARPPDSVKVRKGLFKKARRVGLVFIVFSVAFFVRMG